MKFRKNIITSTLIISSIFLSFNSSSNESDVASYDGKKDIEKILKNNVAVDKNDYILNYYKARGSKGMLSLKENYNFSIPMEMFELANLEHEYFKDTKYRQLSLDELDKLSIGESNDKLNNLRHNSVYNESIKIGIQNALYKVLFDFKDTLEGVAMDYQHIFNFSELMLANGKLIPPVILEIHAGVSKESNEVLRSTDAEYLIYSQAEVSLKPPTYFDYLNFEPIKPQEPESILLPINDKERELWKKGSQEGWILGIKQGVSIINEGFASLARDYIGMQRFHMMRDSGIISMPELEKFTIGTTTNGDRLNIGEITFTITILPEFNSDSKSWKALPQINDFLFKDDF